MKTIKTGKCELLLVKVLKEIGSIEYNSCLNTLSWDNYESGYYDDFIELPKANYQLINTVKDISEEEAKNIIPSIRDVFLNYSNSKLCDTYDLKTAKDSLNSLMNVNEIYLINPYKEDWDDLCTWGHGSFAKDGKSEHQLFTEAEENNGNWVILKVI